MRFGVREITDVTFKAKADTKIGNQVFKKGQPVLFIDSAKTSQLEGGATAVYAQGGRGNTRLLSWEGWFPHVGGKLKDLKLINR